MLTLPIQKQWYDMILSGEKKEEYREIKPYYTSRFSHLWGTSFLDGKTEREIVFRNGYNKDSPTFIAVCTIDEGVGNPKWGADYGVRVYRLHIKRIIQ